MVVNKLNGLEVQKLVPSSLQRSCHRQLRWDTYPWKIRGVKTTSATTPQQLPMPPPTKQLPWGGTAFRKIRPKKTWANWANWIYLEKTTHWSQTISKPNTKWTDFQTWKWLELCFFRWRHGWVVRGYLRRLFSSTPAIYIFAYPINLWGKCEINNWARKLQTKRFISSIGLAVMDEWMWTQS